jgi:DNA-binding transcriptional MocR family regulator
MTIWTPEIDRRQGPVYLAIVEALVEDIGAGRLASGDRLPPQRELAEQLGVTVTTVTRAYAEAAKRGLTAGEVGRGTFVRSALETSDDGPEPIDLTLNALLPHAHAIELASRLAVTGPLGARLRLLDYQPSAGMSDHRLAGRRWLERRNWDVATHEVMVTAGAQHALVAALMSTLPGGGDLLVEEVTYAGLRQSAARLRIPLHAVGIDAHGLRPDDLDATCRRTSAHVLYTMPALHNPTGFSMPVSRQREIAAIAERHDLTIIEDDTYGFLTPDVPVLAFHVPQRALVITSLSKSLMGGLRVGYAAVPPRLADAFAAAIWSTTVMVSPVTAAIATSLVNDGTADRVVAWKREEIGWRQALARRVLSGISPEIHPASPHVWMAIERPWKADIFAAEARRRGVLVTPSTAFAVREGASPRAVRVALGPPRSSARLQVALERLAQLRESVPSSVSVV